MKCETVTIETEAGPVIINKSDFDEDKHKLAKVEKAEQDELKEGSKPWLKAQLDAAGIEYESSASKGDLEEMYMALSEVE